jgi:hypothetical protein
MIYFVSISFFTLHTPFDACAVTSMLPLLSLIDITYCTPDTKATPASVKASASIFRLMWISLFHNVVKRVRKRTARFRCVFGSTDC